MEKRDNLIYSFPLKTKLFQNRFIILISTEQVIVKIEKDFVSVHVYLAISLFLDRGL